jgi:rhodanese-related sulfurtransferase
MNPLEITAAEVKKQLDAGQLLHLIDVREPMEHATASIEDAELIPMNSVPKHVLRLEELSETGTLVVFCHHGMRSMMVVNWLREQGVVDCASMAGGIDCWSMEVDPQVPRY